MKHKLFNNYYFLQQPVQPSVKNGFAYLSSTHDNCSQNTHKKQPNRYTGYKIRKRFSEYLINIDLSTFAKSMHQADRLNLRERFLNEMDFNNCP